jgi:anti-sigma-K factor RskA
MTQPIDDLTALATPYALHAMSEAECADIDRRLASAPPDVARAFGDEVRAVRETMAAISAATAVEPPNELRDRVLAEIGRTPAAPAPVIPMTPRAKRWRTAVLAAAAALIVGLGALGVGFALRPPATTAEQIFAAPDVRTVSGDIPGGGRATVVFSRDKDAGVLVMNNVAPPKTGTVYQMWLINDEGPHSAGTMDAQAIAPSTTAVLPDLDGSSTLAFTIEPAGGSLMPTTAPFAALPLT